MKKAQTKETAVSNVLLTIRIADGAGGVHDTRYLFAERTEPEGVVWLVDRCRAALKRECPGLDHAAVRLFAYELPYAPGRGVEPNVMADSWRELLDSLRTSEA